MAGVVQLTDAEMLAGAKSITDGIQNLGVLYSQIASTAEELSAVGMKGAAGVAMHAKIMDTSQQVQKVNVLANEKSTAIVNYVHHNHDGEAQAASFFSGC